MRPRRSTLYCVIAVLLNGVLALAWVVWREIDYSREQAAQINELQNQLKMRSNQELAASKK
jgi:hypothetical protein